ENVAERGAHVSCGRLPEQAKLVVGGGQPDLRGPDGGAHLPPGEERLRDPSLDPPVVLLDGDEVPPERLLALVVIPRGERGNRDLRKGSGALLHVPALDQVPVFPGLPDVPVLLVGDTEGVGKGQDLGSLPLPCRDGARRQDPGKDEGRKKRREHLPSCDRFPPCHPRTSCLPPHFRRIHAPTSSSTV